MKITFLTGATARKLIDGKPDKIDTRFFGGETEDVVDEQAEALMPEFAVKANSKEAKAFLKGHVENPRTRRQRLDAETPGLREKLAGKAALAAVLSKSASEAVKTAQSARGGRSRSDMI